MHAARHPPQELREEGPARAAATVKHIDATGPTSQVGQWSGPIGLDVVAIHTTLMPNGKVLFFYNNPTFGDEALGRVEVWDPATQTGVRRDVPANIWCGGQVLLADGRVLVVGGNLKYEIGGTGGSFKGLNQIWIFDPTTETWTQGPNMQHGRWYPTATKLPDGRVLISAGWDETGGGAAANNQDIEVYTPAADGHGPGTVQVVASRNTDYYPHLYVLPDGRVILAGPRDVDTAILNPANWTFTDIPDLKINLDYGYGAGVLLPGPPSGSNKVLLIGGANGVADTSTATTEQFDASNPSAGWSFKAPLPQSRRNVNGVILPDGKILAVGGNTTGASDGYRTSRRATTRPPTPGRRSPPRPRARGYHSTAILLPDARVLSAGDDTVAGGGWTSDVAENYSPPYLFKGARPTITSAPTSVGYNAPFTIGTERPGEPRRAGGAGRHHARERHEPARTWSSPSRQTTGGVLATSPPSANVAPPGPYMLFLLNSAGVPSAARFVSVGTGPPPPPDTTPPTVSVSAPAAGATVVGHHPGQRRRRRQHRRRRVSSSPSTGPTSAPRTPARPTRSAGTRDGHQRDPRPARGRPRRRRQHGHLEPGQRHRLEHRHPAARRPGGRLRLRGDLGHDGRRLLGHRQHRHDRRRGRPSPPAGKIGRAIDFDGVNDLVSIPDANSLDLTTGMTLEAWVQPDTLTSWREVILKERPGDLTYSLYANTSSNRPQSDVATTGGDKSAGITPQLTTGAWTHLAVTYDGANLRLYKNGALVTTTAAPGALVTSANPLRIGGNTIWGEYFDGRIDEVRVYNRALSAAEITTDMTTPVGGGGPPPPDTTPPTVSVSSPAAGASVAGTIPVNATAADNVGVAGVQFTLDGANLGAEDTARPTR